MIAPVAWNPAAQHNANGRCERSHSVPHCARQHLLLPVGSDAIRFSVVSLPLQRPVCCRPAWPACMCLSAVSCFLCTCLLLVTGNRPFMAQALATLTKRLTSQPS